MADAEARAEKRPRTTTAERPLSPHLQIYKPMLTMLMSGMHRITGFFLYFGTLLLAIWLIAAATDAKAFQTVAAIYGSWFGRLVLFGYSWALLLHLMGGLRHFVWDTGRAMGHPEREYMVIISLVGSIVLTAIVWIIVFARS
ncbi:MAG: succinate dehydrogenase, cytochrome b556 subunit [Methylobacteriaceae bacterium]|nr:succinate dehydrogenase, cytochrome b556 subunit [Methylobacteriaceae bacterium]